MKYILILSNNYTYEGTIQHNEPHGYGTFMYVNGDKYTGYCAFGRSDGFGKYTFSNGNTYVGYFSAGKLHGIGTYDTKTKISKGQWRHDKKHGNFLETDKSTCKTTRQIWIKDKLKMEEPTQYIAPECLDTTKDNPRKSQKKRQVSYKAVEKKCLGCGEMPMNSTIANCGHVCMCYECLEKCEDKCPICRGPIDQIIKLYVS